MSDNSADHLGVSGEILSITINSRIVPSLAGKPVEKPNWEPGGDLADGPYSQRPGVFEIDNPRFKGLIVTLQVKGLSAQSQPLLIGKLRYGEGDEVRLVNFTGKIKNSGSVQTVTVVPAAEPENFIWLYGDMEWFLESAKKEVTPIVRTTRVEMFWIYSYPGKMFLRRGVWVEALRLLGDICKKNKTKDDIIKKIVNYCHSGASLRYDSYYGSCYFVDGGEGGLFKLQAFLEKVMAICNCYDQAGAVQTLLGAIGVPVDWLYMYPFGYIRTTGLTGWKACNNPLFLSAGDGKKTKIVPKNDPNRTGFSNHAFCGIHKQEQIYILDSCVGPHFGDETPQHYIKKSIDSKTDLYSGETIPHSGTIKNIHKHPGILYVDVLGCDLLSGSQKNNKQDDKDRRVKAFKKCIGFEDCGKDLPPGTGVVCPWEDKFDKPPPGLGKCIFDNMRFGCNSSVLERIYEKNNERLRIEIFVSSRGIETAKNRLLELATATTMGHIPFDKSPENPGHLCVTADRHRRKRIICIFYNVCFVVEAQDSAQDILTVLRWLCKTAGGHVVKDFPDHTPKIEKVVVSPASQRIKTGEQVSIFITPAADKKTLYNLGLVFLTGGESLIFEHEEFYSPEKNNYSLEFRGKSTGKTRVFSILANWRNLLCTTREVNITVSEAN